MISSNLSSLPSPTARQNFSVLNSLMVVFFLSLWGRVLLLSTFLFFFLTSSTVLFPYIVTLTKQRDQGPRMQQLHICIGRRCTARGVMAKMLLSEGCFHFFSLFSFLFLWNKFGGQELWCLQHWRILSLNLAPKLRNNKKNWRRKCSGYVFWCFLDACIWGCGNAYGGTGSCVFFSSSHIPLHGLILWGF